MKSIEELLRKNRRRTRAAKQRREQKAGRWASLSIPEILDHAAGLPTDARRRELAQEIRDCVAHGPWMTAGQADDCLWAARHIEALCGAVRDEVSHLEELFEERPAEFSAEMERRAVFMPKDTFFALQIELNDLLYARGASRAHQEAINHLQVSLANNGRKLEEERRPKRGIDPDLIGGGLAPGVLDGAGGTDGVRRQLKLGKKRTFIGGPRGDALDYTKRIRPTKTPVPVFRKKLMKWDDRDPKQLLGGWRGRMTERPRKTKKKEPTPLAYVADPLTLDESSLPEPTMPFERATLPPRGPEGLGLDRLDSVDDAPPMAPDDRCP